MVFKREQFWQLKVVLNYSAKDGNVSSRGVSGRTTPSHYVNSRLQSPYSEEFYSPSDVDDPGQNERYIYVTYPPELKRRLLER